MSHRNIHIEDGTASAIVAIGLAVPSSAQPRRGDAQILQFQKPIVAAASMALEDASSSDWDVPPTIGELAVRIVGQFELPRIVVMTVKGEEEEP